MNINQRIDLKMEILNKLYEICEAHKKRGDQSYHQFLSQKDMVSEIIELQLEKDVIILGHNYMLPDVFLKLYASRCFLNFGCPRRFIAVS